MTHHLENNVDDKELEDWLLFRSIFDGCLAEAKAMPISEIIDSIANVLNSEDFPQRDDTNKVIEIINHYDSYNVLSYLQEMSLRVYLSDVISRREFEEYKTWDT